MYNFLRNNGFSAEDIVTIDTMGDPSQVQAVVTDPNTGAGAGVIVWPKTNWLKVSH